MLVYYFVPFIVSNRYLLFWVSNGHNSVTVQNRTHVYMNFFYHKDLGNHLLQLCPKVVKHPVYLHLPSGLFTARFPTKTLHAFLSLLHEHPNSLRCSAQIMKLLILQFSPVSCHFLPLKSKYLTRHPILKHIPWMWKTKFQTHTTQQVELQFS